MLKSWIVSMYDKQNVQNVDITVTDVANEIKYVKWRGEVVIDTVQPCLERR